MLGMKHPDVFGAIVSHSGDTYFDYSYGFDFVKCWRALVKAEPAKWLARFRAQRRAKGDDILVLNIVAMAACYSPNPRSPLGFDLPFELETGEQDAKVMARWREFDPVVACKRYAKNLAKAPRHLRGLRHARRSVARRRRPHLGESACGAWA